MTGNAQLAMLASSLCLIAQVVHRVLGVRFLSRTAAIAKRALRGYMPQQAVPCVRPVPMGAYRQLTSLVVRCAVAVDLHLTGTGDVRIVGLESIR